jgi:tetratricopeptide (TPR) repeat protein
MSSKLDEELFAESWYYVGIAHAGLRQLELAVSAYSKALTLRPLYAHVVHERAKAYQVRI